MPSLFRRQPADRNADATPEPLAAAAAHQIGALLGQLQAVDHLTMAALPSGRQARRRPSRHARTGPGSAHGSRLTA